MEDFWAQVRTLCSEQNISDLILRPGRSLQYNSRGKTLPSPIQVPRSAFEAIAAYLPGPLPVAADIDGAYRKADMRFRVNYFRSRGEEKMVMRLLPEKVPDPDDIRMPEILLKAIRAHTQGLILVCGPTGSGKSTTLAALISVLLKERDWHLVTIEDPIEYPLAEDTTFGDRVTARQVGSDIKDFASGLRSALRQAPKAILVGEIRDRETATMALEASLTGHLVFSTLHTNNAALTCDRFSQLFPDTAINYATSTFADVIKCIVCQRLVPAINGQGRVALHEIMVPTPATLALIRQRKFDAIPNEIDVGRANGHQSFKHAHERAVMERLIAKNAI